MKRSIFFNSLALSIILSIASSGCKHGPKDPTPIPGQKPAITGPSQAGPNQGGPNQGGPKTTKTDQVEPEKPIQPPDKTPGTNIDTKNPNGIALDKLDRFDGRPADREIFKAYTVYFDFDSSAVKSSEKSKLEAIADAMKKGPPANDLVIEGHCDERGTEEYNRALGERRALALREYLVNLGLGSERIRTISYGKDHPADPGHNDEAWGKNRRGEFLLLLPKP